MSDIERLLLCAERLENTYGSHVLDQIAKELRELAARQAPANVPEGWSVRRVDDRITVQHPDFGGYCADPNADDKSQIAPVILYHLAEALLTTPTPATTPEAEWVKPSEDLPSENGRNPVWYWDNHQGVMLIPEHEAHRRLLRSEAHNPHWMPTGLKRPTPPQEQ